MKKRILIIDDDESVVFVIKEILEDMGNEVIGETNPEKGIQIALESEFDLIIVDLRMPGKNGAEVTQAIIAGRPGAKILINTGFPGDYLAERALEAGAITLIKKPFEIEKIYDILG